MLINELYEAGGFWKGVGQSLGQRYTPGFDFTKTSYNTDQKLRQAANKVGQSVGRVAAVSTPTQPQPSVSPVPPAKNYSQYQAPTVFRKATQPVPIQQPTTPAAAAAQPTSKPRVLAQPIRVGNQIYRPGDPMHARLAQMMQAQKKT